MGVFLQTILSTATQIFPQAGERERERETERQRETERETERERAKGFQI